MEGGGEELTGEVAAPDPEAEPPLLCPGASARLWVSLELRALPCSGALGSRDLLVRKITQK